MARSREEIISEMVDSGLFTDDEIRQAVKPAVTTPPPTMMGQAWNALKVPEQMARQVLSPETPMTSAEPQISPSIPKTILSGAPRVLEQSARDIGMVLKRISPPVPQAPVVAKAERAMTEFAPGLVSPEALLIGGGLKVAKKAGQILKPFIKGAGAQVESIAGAAPGSLEAAYKDPTLIAAKGKKAVQELYETAKTSTGGGFRKSFKAIPEKKSFVEAARNAAENGTLTPAEALEARKALDQVKKQVSEPFYRDTRDMLDKIAKVAFEKGDEAYKRAIKAESLRQLMPQNKYGGASAFKMGIITGLQGLAETGGIPKVIARAAGAVMSPAAAGLAATGAGVAARAVAPVVANPALAMPMVAAAKVLTESKAKEYLKAAKSKYRKLPDSEQRAKAREMARAEGWEIPED